MVYIDPNELKWLPFVQSWLNKLNVLQEDLKDFVLELFKRAVDRMFYHIAKHCDQGISQVRINVCLKYKFFSVINFYFLCKLYNISGQHGKNSSLVCYL